MTSKGPARKSISILATAALIGLIVLQSCSQATCPANERYSKHKKIARINHRKKKVQRGLWPKKMQTKQTAPKPQPQPNGDL